MTADLRILVTGLAAGNLLPLCLDNLIGLDAYNLNPFFTKSLYRYYSSVDTTQYTSIPPTSCSPFDSTFTGSSIRCAGLVTSVASDRAIRTDFIGTTRLLITQILIEAGPDLDLTIGYKHAFYESSWNTVS